MKEKIVALNKLLNILKAEKEQGKTIVATGGCFDILHAGHVTYLEEAARKGDIFIIFLNSDSSVKRLKGNNKPIVPESERALILSALQCVDFVYIFDEDTPCKIIETTQPNVFVKGGDYQGVRIPEMEVVKKYGGRVEYVSMVGGCSTTNIVNKILTTMGGKRL